MLLRDKVVVVSGVGPGLGQAIAVRAAAQGASVVLAARTQSYLDEVAKGMDSALVVPTDITDDAAVSNLVQETTAAFGRVDVVVNNAFAMPTMRDMSKADLTAVKESFETNVVGTLRVTQAFVPALTESRGTIVMVNSAVLRHSRRTFGTYKMAKSALSAMAHSLAAELGPKGIRVNSVAPSYIWSETLKAYFEYLGAKRGMTGDQIYEEIASTTDLKRLAQADEVADAVLFLASDRASAITGHTLDVNCGEFHR